MLLCNKKGIFDMNDKNLTLPCVDSGIASFNGENTLAYNIDDETRPIDENYDIGVNEVGTGGWVSGLFHLLQCLDIT
jgi:hypothetical protein